MKSGLKVHLELAEHLAAEVATYAAMKSGLKVFQDTLIEQIAYRSNLCRDEKRTESEYPPHWTRHTGSSRSNLCRDEKRTESSTKRNWATTTYSVATYAAMKSGLKGVGRQADG